MKRILCLFTPILFFAIPAFAQLGENPPNFCRGGFFPHESDNYRIAKIKGKTGERIFFYGDESDDCPENKNCRTKSYVIPNDEVIVSRAFGNWACSWYQPKKGGGTVGWIAVDKLEFLETKTDVSKNDWLGDWTYYDNTISIGTGKAEGFLSIRGNAVWHDPGDNTHEGHLDYEVKPDGNILKIDDDVYGCKVTMRLVGRFIIASDNLQCGGFNVSFSGVYRRK
jgi:hypothetical protein